MGIRHPGFTQGLSLASYEAGLVDIDLLIKQALLADNELKVELQSGNKTAHTVSSRTRKKAAQETKQAARETQTQHRQKPTEVQTRETDEEPEQKQPKKDRFEGIKNFFNNFFD